MALCGVIVAILRQIKNNEVSSMQNSCDCIRRTDMKWYGVSSFKLQKEHKDDSTIPNLKSSLLKQKTSFNNLNWKAHSFLSFVTMHCNK